MRPGRNETTALQMLRTSGEMRRRLESFAWERTPLDPRGRWPQSLALAAEFIMQSGFPIYNDAYVPLLGQKHSAAFGRPVRETDKA
jgi:hypothetical protein